MVNTIPLRRLGIATGGWGVVFRLVIAFCLLCFSQTTVFAEVFSRSLDSEQYERDYLVVTPDKVRSGERLPTIIALHGPLMSGKSMRRLFGLEEIAQKEKFAVVYPDGHNRRWNDGRTVDENAPDDVRFITLLAKRLINDGIADPNRLYLLGMATGGMLTYRIACETSDTFTAYAAVVAEMPKRVARKCRAQRALPILLINSTANADIPLDGDAAEWSLGTDTTISSVDTLEFWRKNNDCIGRPQIKPIPDKDPLDGSTVVAEQYNECEDGMPVVSFRVEGGGRLPPGTQLTNQPTLLSVLGRPNQDISAAAISLKFFKRFGIPRN